MSDELKHMEERYERRKEGRKKESSAYVNRVVIERQTAYADILYKYFKDPKEVKVLEVGAGAGFNLHFSCRQAFLRSSCMQMNCWKIG